MELRNSWNSETELGRKPEQPKILNTGINTRNSGTSVQLNRRKTEKTTGFVRTSHPAERPGCDRRFQISARRAAIVLTSHTGPRAAHQPSNHSTTHTNHTCAAPGVAGDRSSRLPPLKRHSSQINYLKVYT